MIEEIKTPEFHNYFRDNDIKLRDIECGNSLSMVIDIDDNCYMFGWNNKGQIGCGKKNTVQKFQNHIKCIMELIVKLQ